MARYEGALAERIGLIEVVDRLLDKGVVLAGDATVALGGVDLVYLGLQVVLSSVETLEAHGGGPMGSAQLLPEKPSAPTLQPPFGPVAEEVPPRATTGLGALPSAGGALQLQEPGTTAPSPVERPERDLAKLVLTVVELLRRVLEHQALRRMEGGALSDPEIERMGVALMELEAKVAELRTIFDLEEGDLNIDLGPLGRLL